VTSTTGLLRCLAVLIPAGASDTYETPLDIPRTNSVGRGDSEEQVSDSSLNVRGVFDSELPGIERKYQLKLILHPHIGDLTRYDHLRTAVGLRYSMSNRLELSAETNTYFGTGLRGAAFFEDYGLLDARFGFKYRLGERLLRDWDSSAGVNYQFPFGSPPPRLTDGFKHLRPFVTFARPVETVPGLRVFWKAGLDLLAPTMVEGRHDRNDLTDDSANISGGFVWEFEKFHYTFEAAYETTRFIGTRHDDVFLVRPGLIWKIPRRFTPVSRGQWMFGLALKLSEGPDGFDVGLSGKLRINLDLKRLLRRQRASPAQP